MWKLGWTEEKKVVRSNLIKGMFKIDTKFYSPPFFGSSSGCMVDESEAGYYVGLINEENKLTLEHVIMYRNYEIGDTMNLSYKELFEVTYNYLPGNFKTKTEISRKFLMYDVLEFEKV